MDSLEAYSTLFFPYKEKNSSVLLRSHLKPSFCTQWGLKVIYIIANKNVLSKTPGFLNTGDNYVGRMILHCHLHFQDTFILPVYSI